MDIMRKLVVAAGILLISLASLSSCASNEATVVEGREKQIKALFVWDADGATDFTLLNNLKGETMMYLRRKGFAISADPDKTDAYVKITVFDATRDPDKKRSYIKARLYIIDAADNSVMYDRTYDASAYGGGFDGPEYPVVDFVEGVLGDFARLSGRDE